MVRLFGLEDGPNDLDAVCLYEIGGRNIELVDALFDCVIWIVDTMNDK